MAGRPKIFDEQTVIDRAIEVFWTKGYESASAEELLKAMEIGKGSFYLSFKGGKKELFEKSLDQFSNKAAVKFKHDLEKSEDPIQFLKNFFLSMADSPKERQLKGCYLGNAIVEMSNIDNKTKDKAVKLLAQLEENFKNIIHQAQQNNLLKTKERPETLAKLLITLWNGINITRRMHPEEKTMRRMIELQLQVLE
jgi:TetR/AcrR family transcriptional repressor of nem operon